MSSNSAYLTKQDILKRAQEAVGIPLGQIDKTGRLKTGKGAIGTVLEESWFGYSPNSESEPDFPEAGVELKATPYLKTKNGISAKERLVCNIIDYMTEYNKTFTTSSFWHKCENLLLMPYEHKKDVPKSEFTVDKAVLFTFPEEDLVIIKRDWETIIRKVRDGQAHLLSEGDTLYLGACTKGAKATDVRQQPMSPIMAKQRAYSLKQSYMTQVLRYRVFGERQDESVIKDWRQLETRSFEDIIIERLRPFYGLTTEEMKEQFAVTGKPKNIYELFLRHMLKTEHYISQTDEFRKAGIIVKTVRVQKKGTVKESMSFPTFKFIEICGQEWEDSDFYNALTSKFMFVVFAEKDDGNYAFRGVKFWNMPEKDLAEAERVWKKTVQTIRNGVQLVPSPRGMHNNLPKASESWVAHVRPHGSDASDTYPLPDGRRMTKQCFWLNNHYVQSQIQELIPSGYQTLGNSQTINIEELEPVASDYQRVASSVSIGTDAVNRTNINKCKSTEYEKQQ